MSIIENILSKKPSCFIPSNKDESVCKGCIGARKCEYRVDLSSGTFEEIFKKDSLNNKEE